MPMHINNGGPSLEARAGGSTALPEAFVGGAGAADVLEVFIRKRGAAMDRRDPRSLPIAPPPRRVKASSRITGGTPFAPGAVAARLPPPRRRAAAGPSPRRRRSRRTGGDRVTRSETLARGREAFEDWAWEEARARLSEADEADPLEPPDLQRLATAAYLVGREAESEEVWARAHQAHLDGHDVAGAARCALRLAFQLQSRGEGARAAHPTCPRPDRRSPHPAREARGRTA